jgi:predicted nucleic acid-binding protein
MILLDTNVVSEMMRIAPDPHVLEWMDAQPLETFYLSAVTVAELRAGVALLPTARRPAASGVERGLGRASAARVYWASACVRYKLHEHLRQAAA